MALFGKNPNEVAYTGGKKHWADVIKNTGPGERVRDRRIKIHNIPKRLV